MPTVNWYRQSGGALGGDRRARLQGINLSSTEQLRAVRVYGQFSITVFGDANPLPPNFNNLIFGVAVGPNLATPPTGDPFSNTTGEDWLAIWLGVNHVNGRSTNNTINAWEFEMTLAPNLLRRCPRIAYGTPTSIWLVTNPLTAQGTAPFDWSVRLGLEYLSFIP